MDTSRLQPLMRRFLENAGTDRLVQGLLADYERRKEQVGRLLQSDYIAQLTREEITGLLEDTNAWYGVRGRQAFWRRLFGEDDQRLPAIRQALTELVQRSENDLNASDFNDILAMLPGIGPAYLSEILALRHPHRYWLLNGPIYSFFEAQGIHLKDELPYGKKGDEGEAYFAAGRHLMDLRKALSDVAGQPVDQLITDLFVYWLHQQKQTDLWAAEISKIIDEFLPQDRLQAREAGEAHAREHLGNKAGQFTADDVAHFAKTVSRDRDKGNTLNNRFMPALYGQQIYLMTQNIEAFNTWTERLWAAEVSEIDNLLEQFWAHPPIKGAGRTLPTVILYLRDPQRYNIWLGAMEKGLAVVSSYEPSTTNNAAGYRRYNEAVNNFRDKYRLMPQALDLILWKLSQQSTPDDRTNEDSTPGFSGFKPDTFQFLRELEANNTKEWMHKDNHANEIRYRQILREPLRELFKAVAPTITVLDPGLETEAKVGKVMANLQKNWANVNKGMPYNPYYWGAFYRIGRTKQTDAQLFIVVHTDHISVGFSSAGTHGADILEHFQQNLKQFPDTFLQLLANIPDGFHIYVTTPQQGSSAIELDHFQTTEALDVLLNATTINVQRIYPSTPAAQADVYTPEFAEAVAKDFEALHPLFRFATIDEPSILVDMEGGEEDADSGEERYTREQLIARTYLDASFWESVELLMQDKQQIILYGPPGTGKTKVAREFARYWIDTGAEPGGEVSIVQFHPSYAYEEFIEGIRPASNKNPDGSQSISYPIKKGAFRRFCENAILSPKRRHVIILDEINRGELPRIFGELLYLLEYRNQIIKLPYSGDDFYIPNNVYIVGTMNTADRSIALLDHALRRRFHFVRLKPNADILRSHFGSINPEMTWIADLLELLNSKLEKNDRIEWHLHIGHSHFMGSNFNEARLRLIWEYTVMPTLEEYLYRQPEHLQEYQLDTLRAELGKS